MTDVQIMRQSRTFGEYLQKRYGEKGTPDREAFEAKATAFYICEMLKAERENAKVSQKELAERLQMKASFISRVERGKVDVQLSTLAKIAAALDLKITLAPAA